MRSLIEALPAPTGVVIHDRWRLVNAALVQLAGCDPTGAPMLDLFAEDDREMITSSLREVRAGATHRHQVTWLRGRETHAVDVDLTSWTYDGEPCVLVSAHDARVRELFAKRLMESEARFQRVLASATNAIVATDDRGRIIVWNRVAEEIFGYANSQAIGEPFAMLLAEGFAAAYAPDQFAAGTVEALDRTVLLTARRRCASEFPAEVSFSASSTGGTTWFTAIIRDDTERQRLLHQLARSEANARSLVEESPDAVFVHRPDDYAILFANRAMVAMLGYRSPRELVGRRSIDLFVHPEDRDRTEMPVRWIRRDGAVLDIQASARRFTFDDRPATLVYARDVTSALRLEEQLRQAQKMDAVGRLAGGIAHDFNNILAVILSNASMAKEALPGSDLVRCDLDEIEKAAKRAAALTGQLLAFSRKQPRKPRPIALNKLVTSVEKMLSRIVGEDIAMAAVLAPALGTIDADASQVEQLLVNLVVNARDAMPEGGRLTIETTNVEVDDVHAAQLDVPAGRYVCLAVADTGCGMDDAVRARIFEPFFTTKDTGVGTGLGLAIVFGIVKQSMGGLAVCSDRGRGTTFKIYFPRSDRDDVSAEMPRVFIPPRGSETVLVVEDDDQVRSVLRRYLTSWGYTLLEAPNGRVALEVARAHGGGIDLLLTDLVMPEMDGRSLSVRLLAEHPNTRVVLMSGYTEHAALAGSPLAPDEHFVQKPFTAQMLCETVRRALDATPAPAPAH